MCAWEGNRVAILIINFKYSIIHLHIVCTETNLLQILATAFITVGQVTPTGHIH